MTVKLLIFFGCSFWSIDYESKFALALSLCVKNLKRFRICEIVFEGQSIGLYENLGIKKKLKKVV
jgi:hypothetical protein